MTTPRRLEKARSQLQEMRFEDRKEVSRLMSLAECNFRIAVHPETEPSEAVRLLHEAIRIDGANPKYSFHLGRIHFLATEFREAARWLRLACCMAPTSHRVWAHVAVLLRELNAAYHGDENYEPNVLLQRAEEIERAIRSGEDSIDPSLLDFVPPKSRVSQEREARQGQRGRSPSGEAAEPPAELRPTAKVRRYVDANRCRWSGVDHLFIEQVFEGRATQANVRKLLPVLQDLVRKADRRRGGPAAAAILCIQWLLCGYPVTSVRRIVPSLPSGLPSADLLDVICRLFEAPRHAVPRMLAMSVENGQIPPLVAALVHRTRLLWHPLEYRNLGTYRTVRRLLVEPRQTNGVPLDSQVDEEQLEVARDLVRRLDRAAASLAGAPPAELKDEPPPTAQESAAEPAFLKVQFEAFEKAATTLSCLKDEGFRLIKDGLDVVTAELAAPEPYAQAVADRRIAEEFVKSLATAIESGLNRFHLLAQTLSSLSGSQLPPDFAPRSEACISTLQGAANFGKFTKAFKRIDKRIAAAGEKFTDDAAMPAAEWSALIAGVKSALPDERSPSSEAGGPVRSIGCRFTSIESLAAGLEEVRTALSEFLRSTLEPAIANESDTDVRATAVADHGLSAALLPQMRLCAERGLERLDALRDEIAVSIAPALPENFDVRLEQTTNRFRVAMNIGSLQRRLNRIEKAFSADEERPGQASQPASNTLNELRVRVDSTVQELGDGEQKSAPVASVEGDGLSDRPMPDTPLTTALPSLPAVADDSQALISDFPPPPKPRDDLTPLELLEYTLCKTDWSLNRMFAAARETFDSYPEWLRILPPFEWLRRRILARHAETTYRLGRRRAARSIWNGMLRTNRLDVAALKNIAICDTVDQDVARSLNSWREYIELIYLFDVLAESPRQHASLRAQFHRAFGDAYAPGFLSAPFDHEWNKKVEPASLIAFLSSPGRVRNFINHRLLEYLNTRFEFESPSLVFGIKRIEAESHTDTAERTVTAYVHGLETLLPRRVAPQFMRLAEETLRKTAETCRKSSRLTLAATPGYEREEKQQIEILVRMFNIKIKLVIAFREHVDMVKNITSFDFLTELSRLDRIPLELSPGLFPIVANTMRVDGEMLRDLTTSLRQNVVFSLLEYLLSDDDPAEEPIQLRQYDLLTRGWLQNPEFHQFARLIDNPPPQFMPAAARTAITQDNDETVLVFLRRWHDRYPAMAGLSVWIANKLIKRREFDEARTRLEQSRLVVFHEPTRRHIHYLLVQILLRDVEGFLEDENFEQAFDISLRMVDLDDFQPGLVSQTLQLYAAVSFQKGRRHRETEVKQAVDGWLERASALATQSPTGEDEFPRPNEQAIQEVRKAVAETSERLARLSS